MGGCTITKIGDNLDDLFAEMKRQIIAASKSGLWVDSELIIIDPRKKKARLFKVEYAPLGTEVMFTEVERGRAFHVGIAGLYGDKPKEGQIVGTVHVHT